MTLPRASGILLHPTSLPGPWGLGELGPQAAAFIGELAAMRQQYWQVLPLGPTGYGDSPYQSFSSFAGNPLLISFDTLLAEGFLTRAELESFPALPADRVDFGAVIPARFAVLRAVTAEFAQRASATLQAEFRNFCARHAGWLDDYALFMAIKAAHGGGSWTDWPAEFARRDAAALTAARERWRAEIEDVRIQQFIFDRQWQALRQLARHAGIQIIGDAPIFVAQDSADVWANRELFYLDDHGRPTVVAGVPPDYFSATGQLWGNPLYRWDAHAATGYAWWIARLRRTLELVDLVRLDHFRGFEAYWEIPAGESTAIHGRWVKGPGAPFLAALRDVLGGLPLIAEDLGMITDEVHRLRDEFALPGMRILQFSFGHLGREPQLLPEAFPENCAVYTGTHDNDTTCGWFRAAPGASDTRSAAAVYAERSYILKYLHKRKDTDINWAFIEIAFRNRTRLAMVPLQDVLGLGSEARMNIPGVLGGNWQWRIQPGALTRKLKNRLARLTAATARTSL
ncbi:MAG: 4-alpha-glucanotransferase [Kiritimatiellaeota bacterium]|nr:4-alpha-glucanotransferase [Kiritimatiellota bacterium]